MPNGIQNAALRIMNTSNTSVYGNSIGIVAISRVSNSDAFTVFNRLTKSILSTDLAHFSQRVEGILTDVNVTWRHGITHYAQLRRGWTSDDHSEVTDVSLDARYSEYTQYATWHSLPSGNQVGVHTTYTTINSTT